MLPMLRLSLCFVQSHALSLCFPVLLLFSSAPAAELADIRRLLNDAYDLWPEGVMECTVSAHGPSSKVHVKAYWKNDTFRFEYEPIDPHVQDVGKPQPGSGWVIISRRAGFRYTKESDSALICRRTHKDSLESSLQVLPGMAWLNFTPRHSYLEWVTKTAPKFDNTIERTAAGSLRLASSAVGKGFVTVEFNRLGLPMRSRFTSTGDREITLISEHTWESDDDGKPIRPKRLLQKTISINGQELIDLEIDVIHFRQLLGPNPPSLAIPPVDLPANVIVNDIR